MPRKKKTIEPIGVGYTSKQMKRKKPINNDFLIDIDALTTANDQFSTLIAINTRQTVLSDRQVKAIKGAGNLIKGV